ncbi:MAG TPA: hypothetical protein VF633_02530 [Brevundimonas sp.]|jgi:hypothetical protein
MIECDLTNEGQVPVAGVNYTASFTEANRTVPWAEIVGRPTRISGGIEPGETAPILLQGQYLSGRADPSRVRINLRITEAFDVNGDSIPPE